MKKIKLSCSTCIHNGKGLIHCIGCDDNYSKHKLKKQTKTKKK